MILPAVALFMLSAARLLAAGEAGEAAAHGGEHVEPSIFAGDLGNVVWTLITFGAVVFVLGKFAWKPILTALQKREEFIRDSLAKAQRDRQEAEARLKEYVDKLHAARDEASAIVEEGRRDAEVVGRKIQEQARTEGAAMVQRARREIELARDTAVKDLYEMTARLATDVAGRIIDKELDAAGHERLVADSIREIGSLSTSGSRA